MFKLRSSTIYWNRADQRIRAIIGDGKVDIKSLTEDDLEYLISELDRRLIQLWDKVCFERTNELVDYSKLAPGVDVAT